ncbi:hypothetical protein BO85DRAFT_439889 [Aspergillus piperis CBS 112811]|uniref:Uncharacterized protein n=1 Tax=Aspergillus piperis CBS 112811 TaxID=1448313 RepID=A0A8G1R3H3_9EURO|nr:hypothetical protein BO85DRAFT_439889 [Aspergillus piperis CBS 112811]RAH56185.1 hypothetical protein BO85DRAFT_439889 [Aspergillus piperis CBS 112811]
MQEGIRDHGMDDGQGGQHQSVGWIASIGNAFCILQYPKSGTVWNVRLAYADVPGWRTGKCIPGVECTCTESYGEIVVIVVIILLHRDDDDPFTPPGPGGDVWLTVHLKNLRYFPQKQKGGAKVPPHALSSPGPAVCTAVPRVYPRRVLQNSAVDES